MESDGYRQRRKKSCKNGFSLRNRRQAVTLIGMPSARYRRLPVAALASLLIFAVSAPAALAADGGASPGTTAPKPVKKPKPKYKVDPAAGGGSTPGQKTPAKPKKKPKAKPKPVKKPKAKPKKKPVSKPKVKPKPKPKPVSKPKPVAKPTGIFPVRGDHDFGGSGSRFGAGRSGHTHQGQDLSAAEGTPLVAPLAGTILYRGFQEDGAGYYLVLHANDNRDYVFMHLRKGSLKVTTDDRVARGERIAEVGNTGHSTGPHLHFEIWVGGWQSGGHPIDPLSQLKAWDRVS